LHSGPEETSMSRLERATHICLITLSLVSVAVLLERRFAPPPVGSAWTASDLTGKRLTAPGIEWGRAKLNAVLYISTRCHFCADSIPFYERVARAKLPARMALLVISMEPAETVKAYLSAKQIDVDGAYQRSPVELRRYGTPTLLLVDSNGIIRRSYVGKLNPTQEQELLNIIREAAI